MRLSKQGAKMASPSGLRRIMEDIATSSTDRSGGGWLNLSIGNPARIPEVGAMWRRLSQTVLAESFGGAAGLYGPSRGTPELIDAIKNYFNARYGWGIDASNIVVGPGTQMLAFAAATLFAGPGADGPGRILLPVTPDYTGYQGICMQADGITGLAPVAERTGDRRFRYRLDVERVRRQRDVAMMLVSSPGNPTGRCLDEEETASLIRAAELRDMPLIVDHAYGSPFPQVAEVTVEPRHHDRVINLFTASKAGLPGERIGFAIGPARYISPMVSFIANAALHAPQLAQLVVARALDSGELDRITAQAIRPHYRDKRRTAEKRLAELLPATVDWSLHESVGGMFCWLWVDEPWFDDQELYRRLKSRRVFISPGNPFFVEAAGGLPADPHGRRCFRLSLGGDQEEITAGIDRIAETLDEMRHEAYAYARVAA
jgi:valine--pyruvate aminotransferase